MGYYLWPIMPCAMRSLVQTIGSRLYVFCGYKHRFPPPCPFPPLINLIQIPVLRQFLCPSILIRKTHTHTQKNIVTWPCYCIGYQWPVAQIEDRPPRYFTHISITTPVVYDTELSIAEVMAGILRNFWIQIQVAVSEAKRPLHTVTVSEVKRLKIYIGYISGLD